jgi:hypothetical protein
MVITSKAPRHASLRRCVRWSSLVTFLNVERDYIHCSIMTFLILWFLYSTIEWIGKQLCVMVIGELASNIHCPRSQSLRDSGWLVTNGKQCKARNLVCGRQNIRRLRRASCVFSRTAKQDIVSEMTVHSHTIFPELLHGLRSSCWWKQ